MFSLVEMKYIFDYNIIILKLEGTGIFHVQSSVT